MDFFLRYLLCFSLLSFPVFLSAQLHGSQDRPTRKLGAIPVNIDSTRLQKTSGQERSSRQKSAAYYPLDSCFTYTYTLQSGNANADEIIKESCITPEGNTYLVGQTSTAGGQSDGLLQLLDAGGTIVWSKTIGTANRNEVINSVRLLYSGNLVIIGSSTSLANTDCKAFMAEIDLTGNVVWANLFNGWAGYKGAAVSPSQANGIGFTLCGDSTIVYGKTDYAGNVAYAKRLRMADSGSVVGMVKYNYDSWYIGYTGMDSGRHVGIVLHTDAATGALQWAGKFGGNAANADYYLHNLKIFGLRPIVVGIYSQNGGPYRLFKAKVDYSGTVEIFQTFTLPGVPVDNQAQSVISPSAEVISFRPNATDQSLYTFKMILETNPDTLIHWAKKFTLPGQTRLATVENADDGGFLFVNNLSTGNGSDAYFVKTDSVGLLGNCPGAGFPLYNAVQYLVPVPKMNPLVANVSATVSPYSFSVTTLTINSVVLCKSLTCPIRPAEDSCTVSFYRNYRSSSFSDYARSITIDGTSRLVVTGNTYAFQKYEVEYGEGFLAAFDVRGKLLERKKMKIGKSSGSEKIIRLAGGGFVVLGSSTYKSALSVGDTAFISLTKYDAAFHFLWNRSFPIYQTSSAVYGLLEGSDGALYVSYCEGANYLARKISLLKTDAQGNFLWLNHYRPATAFTTGYDGSITQDDNFLYTANYANGNTFFGTLIMKINKTNGQVVWAKILELTGANDVSYCNDICVVNNALVMQGRAAGSGWSKTVVLKVDKNGNLLASKSVSLNGQALPFKMAVTANGQLVLTNTFPPYSSFVRLDGDLNVLHCRRTVSPFHGVRDLKEGTADEIYETGMGVSYNAYESEMYLKKYTYDGHLGDCASDSLVLDFGTQSHPQKTYTIVPFTGPLQLESLPYLESAYSLQENKLVCGSVSACNFLHLSGPAAVCDTSVRVLKFQKSPGCSSSLSYAYNQSQIQVVGSTDSSVLVKFLRSGRAQFSARLFNGCSWISDSLQVDVSVVTSNFGLGPDQLLCSGNSVLLNAHKGYASYLWQDGSTDSVYTVTKPGLYSVTATDACGGVFNDSVSVTAAPPVPFDAGPDRVKCNGDSLQLSAPAGFLNYSWGNDYNISSLTAQAVVVNPLVDTAYYVKAEKTPGCFAYDTVRITVRYSPPVDLGNDKSFCRGDSAVFDAGSGFLSYQWSSGQTTRMLIVKAVGQYAVTGTTAQGCKSYDTAKVLTVYPLPVVNLDKAPALCFGESRTLNAGSFFSYQWSTGATGAAITVSAVGRYSVTVSDGNGCRGSDTAAITVVHPLPAGFLPPDTAICAYGSIELKPLLTFNRYLWSTGDAAPSLRVSKPGLYWLEVTDNNSCKGRDTLLVNPKDCLSGFYAPSAFSPNGDGKNDSFYPLLFGRVKAYRFTVYNRWGQRVFYTTELQKGWEGKVAGTLQRSDVFVWTCTYQFEGETEKIQKGTVTLIR